MRQKALLILVPILLSATGCRHADDHAVASLPSPPPQVSQAGRIAGDAPFRPAAQTIRPLNYDYSKSASENFKNQTAPLPPNGQAISPPQQQSQQPARITLNEVQYMRWLMQFDASCKALAARQSQYTSASAALRQRNFSAEATAADQFAQAWGQAESQFQAHRPPENCEAIGMGYAHMLLRCAESASKMAVFSRQLAEAYQNPSAKPPTLSSDMQVTGQSDAQMASAVSETNQAISAFISRFRADIPADIAGFQVR